MKSMTGFGSAETSSKDFKLEIYVKSTNSRFLDIKFYTPSYYMALESELQKQISRQCQRGHFVVRIERFPQKPAPSLSLNWNKKQVQQWKKLYKDLSKEIHSKNHFSVENLMNREGVIQLIEKPKSLSPQERKKVREIFKKALQSCIQERKREGLILKKDIFSHVQAIQILLSKIHLLNKKQKSIYLKKKNNCIQDGKRNEALEMEKFDIHEEVVRVKEHLKNLKKILNHPLAVGRKMDFYIQEILREMNTIGAKAQLSDLTLKVVEGKFILEKIKEQIQNIE